MSDTKDPQDKGVWEHDGVWYFELEGRPIQINSEVCAGLLHHHTQEVDNPTGMQLQSLATITELRHHAADIAQVVAWLRAHAPERFDPTGQTTMGGLITAIFNEWLTLRRGSLRFRIGRLLDRLWYGPPATTNTTTNTTNTPKEND